MLTRLANPMTGLYTALVAAVCMAACDTGGAQANVGGVERITVGDTLIVRNHAPLGTWGDTMTVVPELVIGVVDGSPELMFGDIVDLSVRSDGSILVLDRQARELREFDATGRYIRTMGRAGSGPGEFQTPTAVRVDARGRAFVLDANQRVTVFGTDGTLVGTWPIERMRPSYSLPLDTAGNAYVMIRLPSPADTPSSGTRPPSRLAYVRYSPDGTPGDTVPRGGWVLEPPDKRRVTMANGRLTMENFVPLGITQIHPTGAIVTGDASRYAFDMYMPDAVAQTGPRVLRMERVVEPTPITEAEAADWQAYIDAVVRMDTERLSRLTLPAGAVRPQLQRPYFPDPPVKPYFRWAYIDSDGRIRVWRYVPAIHRVPDPPPGDGTLPVPNWVEPYVEDVFAADGTFLGTVVVPEGYDIAFARGDLVWGVRRDEFDVQHVVRSRMVPRKQVTDQD